MSEWCTYMLIVQLANTTLQNHLSINIFSLKLFYCETCTSKNLMSPLPLVVTAWLNTSYSIKLLNI